MPQDLTTASNNQNGLYEKYPLCVSHSPRLFHVHQKPLSIGNEKTLNHNLLPLCTSGTTRSYFCPPCTSWFTSHLERLGQNPAAAQSHCSKCDEFVSSRTQTFTRHAHHVWAHKVKAIMLLSGYLARQSPQRLRVAVTADPSRPAIDHSHRRGHESDCGHNSCRT